MKNKVRDERVQQGLTKKELADKAGIDPQTISRAENGKSVKEETKSKIAIALGKKTNEIFFE